MTNTYNHFYFIIQSTTRLSPLSLPLRQPIGLLQQFPLLQFLLQQSNPSIQPMKNKRVQQQKWAYKFTKPTIMKFQPLQDYQQPSPETNTFVNRIKHFFSPPKEKPKTSIKRMNSLASSEIRQQLIKKHTDKKPLLKYVKRLTNEHVLIGNQDQIDAMSISGIIHEFVDTQFIWSLNIKKAILHMAIDYKKNYIILLPEKEILVYQYDSKLIRKSPSLLTSFKLANEVRFVQVIKDSVFILCYASGIQVLNIDEVKGIRVTASKKYDIPVGVDLRLLQIPPPYQNILNIFFEEIIQSSTSLALWNIELEFSQKDVKMSKAHKVYDIPKFLRKYLRLQNYSKDIYLINLGRLIYAVRKGYIIDFANVNISSQGNYLKYISHQKLMHISSTKVQIYEFKVDMTVNPPRIVLESSDSIELPCFPQGYQYLDAVQILTDNFAIFYQTRQQCNKMMHGQLKYGFVLSHLVKMEDKIKQLLPNQIKSVDIDIINEKADMVNKMGLQRKDIYLRLWNNSQKTSVQDYKILLDTLDYDTIKIEIQKKLKKASMNLRQLILLQQGCLSMLNKNVYGPNPTKEDIKNYFICHLLIRKFELYRLFSNIDKKEGKAVTEDEDGKLLINIQNYNYYKTVDIKSFLYQLINMYCNQDKDVIMKIRVLLKHFKFSLRINYQEILQNIIVKTKKKFIKILQAIPELLPYDHPPHVGRDEDEGYYQGIWQQISSQQWQKHLHWDNVITIDNKQALGETCSNVWFKRHWLSQHQFVNQSKKQIHQIHKLNCSDATFYNVIEKTFDNLKEYSSIKTILDHIQNKYEKLPTHLFGKIFLYRKLYQQFKQNKKINKIQKDIDSFKDFLRMKDENIFKVMFNFEKVKKNFILAEMKPLYMKLAGSEIFNEGLLNYFASDLSQISDIKYLLNRMNNQKIQFHQQNEGIYEVLVRGMQLKLKLGSDSDIPIDQVLIYIENIPLSSNNPIMKDLEMMRLINQQADRFKKIKLNMSIFEMMKNIDDVIASLVIFQIKEDNVFQMREYAEIKDITHRIINDVQQLKKKIFSDTQYSQLTLFVYLTKLLQEQKLIPAVAMLLEDDWINRNFNLNQTMIENIVLYMYKWRMNNKPSFAQSGSYLKEIINLLPLGSKCRQYIQAEIQFSQILSTPQQNIYYPLSNGKEYFTKIQLQNIINNTPATHLLTVNIEHLHQCSLKIQSISTDNKHSQIKLHDVYEMIILRLIECGLLREVISRIKALIQIRNDSPFNFIYPSLLVAKIAPELIDENRNLLLKCSSYLFYKPKQLTDILESLMSIKATSSGYKALLQGYHNKYQLIGRIYSQGSPIFEQLYLNLLQNDELKANFNTILKDSLKQILQYKQSFYRKPEFYISFIILCNDPFILTKYIYCTKYTMSIKDLRCFISLIVREEAFNSLLLLQFAKRMFFILQQSVIKNKDIQSSIEEARQFPLSINKEIHRIKETKTQFQKILSKSLESIKFKLKSVKAKMDRKKARGKIEPQQKKLQRFRQRLLNPEEKQKPLRYTFIDSDDTPDSKSQLLKREERNRVAIIEGFDTKFEREFLMKRATKDIGLFISIEKQKQQRSLYYTQKYTNDGIYGSLHSDNRIGYILETAMNKAFRQSVKRSPRKMRIGNVTNELLEPNALDLIEIASSRRSKSPTFISQEELQQIHKVQEIIVREEVIPQVQNILLEAFVIDQILKGHKQITENSIFNFEPLQKYKRHNEFSKFLKEIIRLSFGKDIPFRAVLFFISKLIEKYPESQVNKQWLQVYMKAQNLQNKFSLELPLKDMLKPDGLFIDSQIPDRLFHFLLPSIIEQSNQQNVMKICKVITLAFKKPDLQQQILFSYLIKLFVKYQQSIYESNIKQHELRMQKQKIFLILNKIPIKILVQRDEQLTKELSQQSTKKQIIGLVITSFRRRYDTKSAEYMQSKWINKQKNAKIEQ